MMSRLEADPKFDPAPAKAGPGRDPEAATSSLVWGILAIFTWWVPLINPVIPLASLVRGWGGWHAPNRDRARLGAVLSILALGMGVVVVAWLLSLARSFAGTDF
jgi:hypothetical protein